jgi:protein-disulfide isomerase-like protein with CxxC motif
MSVITWLDKIGTDIKNDFAKVEPVAEEAVEIAGKIATPFISIYAPALLPAVQTALTAIATAQAAGVTAAGTQTTGPAKLAAVVSTIDPIIQQAFLAEGYNINTTSFVNALVAALDTISVADTPAAPVAPSATPAVSTAKLIPGATVAG